MPRSKASRKYQLTINNPAQLNLTHDIIRSSIESLSTCTYWCLCDEVGHEGTPHTHLYLAFRNAVEFSTIQQHFYGAHIEPARGKHSDNRAYILKDGEKYNKLSDGQYDYTDSTGKKHTGINYSDTFEESGSLPPDTDARQTQSAEIFSMVEAGCSNAEIIRAFPSAMTKLSYIEQTRQTLLDEALGDTWRDLNVTYLYGDTGVGKTRGVMEKYGYRNVYRVTNYAHPFDDYKGQKVIIFEEYRSSLPLEDMLKYLDGYPVSLPCRYADKVACFTEVYIITNIPLESQYPNIQISEPKSYDAFKRRIHHVISISNSTDGIPFCEGAPIC